MGIGGLDEEKRREGKRKKRSGRRNGKIVKEKKFK